MSRRTTRLCDSTWGGGGLCSKLAIGTCCVCDKDLCEDHTTFAPIGGVSVTFLVQTKHRDGANTVVTKEVRMHICYDCSNKLAANTRERIDEMVRVFGAQTHEALRAAFAEKALTAKGDD